MFETASRTKLRIDSPKGQLTVEDLWDLPLVSTSPTRLDLNTVAKSVSAELRQSDSEDFVGISSSSAKQSALELKLNIIKHIIAIKKAELAAKEVAASKASQRQLIESILAKKQVEGLENKSAEELQALLATL